MSFNVIIGPAALSYVAMNGNTYWMGYASGHQSTGISRRSSNEAIADATKLERENKMTELQLAIGHLNETMSVGRVLLRKLEKKQKDLEKPKAPEFPHSFLTVKDDIMPRMFVIGLRKPISWGELPKDFSGRACFDEKEIRQIITGLQTLLGDK